MARESTRSVAPDGSVSAGSQSDQSVEQRPGIAAPPVAPPRSAVTAPPLSPRAAPVAVAQSASVGKPAGARKRSEQDPRSIALWLLELAPSWLTSVVFHMLLVIALGLIVYNAPARVAPVGFELGGGSGQGGLGGEAEDLTGALQGLAEVATPTVDIMAPAPSVALSPTIELPTANGVGQVAGDELSSMFVKGAMHGDGAGLGTGDGLGTGIGSGNAGSGTGLGTASTRTQVFGVTEEANSFVYVFDRSDSMNSVLSWSSEGSNVFSITPLEAAKAELLRSLEDLSNRQRFQIVFYNNAASLFRQTSASQHLLSGSRANKRQAEDYVTAMPGAGGTYHMTALEIALRLRPDVIFLLTDGEEKDDPTPRELKELRKLNRGRTRINVIHFCLTPRPRSTLERLAKENRGRHLSFLLTRLAPNMMDALDPARIKAPQRPKPNAADEALALDEDESDDPDDEP